MSENKPIEAVPSRKKFKINGEDKELFISFAAQQKISELYGGFTGIASLYEDSVIQIQAVGIVLLGKEYSQFENVGEVYEYFEDFSTDEIQPVQEWIQEYFTAFTLAQTQRLQTKVNQLKPVVEQTLQK